MPMPTDSPQTLDLTDFLRWQYDMEEDGRVRALRDLAEVMAAQRRTSTSEWLAEEADRLLADIDAKRRVVALHSTHAPYGFCDICSSLNADGDDFADRAWPCDTAQALALPYADHPAFRPEWLD